MGLGWQPRWFLLCGGILSYYDSPEDAWKGCKGSIQMAVCEIQVHSVDNTRMDLIIPGEQCFYLKARSVAERQRWLVALGSAKACLTDSRTQKEKEFAENTENLKTKMSELRLYCDLLVQQVDKTKEVTTAGVANSEEAIDVGTLLKSTCNTFLKTLDECMQIANAAFTSELLYRTPPGSPQLAVLKSNKTKHPVVPIHNSLERQMDLNNCENGSLNMEVNSDEETVMKNKSSLYSKSAEVDCSISSEENTDNNVTVQGEIMKEDGEEDLGNHDSDLTQPESDSVCSPESLWENSEEVIPTFFSTMNTSFSDIELLEDSGIPTEAFLASCYAVVPVLDKLGPTVFAPVKMDLVGNIKKVNQKYITNKEEFTTLQKIVLHEVEADVAQVRNSATEALLWLKRGLKFLKGFLTEVKNGEKDIQTALNVELMLKPKKIMLKSKSTQWQIIRRLSMLSARLCDRPGVWGEDLKRTVIACGDTIQTCVNALTPDHVFEETKTAGWCQFPAFQGGSVDGSVAIPCKKQNYTQVSFFGMGIPCQVPCRHRH
ncbi:pleckstrin homology domain-containing family A member 8 isoform X2 [Nannospalax galili]|uniref:pleckstrin homology domain-containing family A member 8 isoform X2 n=1 Tax=Nannospalax galili TaxID=1026970 RepID=UPI00111C4398|nr:pleckstrin homology domain-containing family A member 8 isoform X2 [Nannospalax galili]